MPTLLFVILLALAQLLKYPAHAFYICIVGYGHAGCTCRHQTELCHILLIEFYVSQT